MKSTTARRFGSSGKSFTAPSAVAPTIGAALLASGTSETADTAWSPSAACLLPDILPVAGTLLSYGGSRQLAAGGTVSHSGSMYLGGDVCALNTSKIGWQANSVTPTDAYFVRNAVSSVGVKGASGIDGTLTCGDLTASGVVYSSTQINVGGSGSSAIEHWTGGNRTGTRNFMTYAGGGFVGLGNNWRLAFSSSDAATCDASVSRNAAGILQIGTTASNASGSLLLTNLTASGNVTGNTGYFSSYKWAFTTVAAAGRAQILGDYVSVLGFNGNDGSNILGLATVGISYYADNVLALGNGVAGNTGGGLRCGTITASGAIEGTKITASVAQGSSGLVHKTNSYDILGTIYDGAVMWIKEMPGFVPLGLGTQTGMSILLSPGSSKVQQRDGVNAQCSIINKSYTSDASQEALMLDAGKQISGKLGLYSYRGTSGGSNNPIQIGMLAADGSTFSGLSIATNGQITSGYTAMQDGFRVGSCMSTNWSSIYQVKLHPNTWIGWDSVGETGNSVDIQLNRKSLGKLAVRGDNGLCVRNLADSADAALTCGAITASAKSSFPLGFQVGSYGHFRSDGTYGMIQSFYNNGNGTATATSSFLPTVASGFSLGEVGYTGWTYLLLQSGSGTAILRPAATDTVEVRNSSNTGAGNLACGAITASGAFNAPSVGYGITSAAGMAQINNGAGTVYAYLGNASSQLNGQTLYIDTTAGAHTWTSNGTRDMVFVPSSGFLKVTGTIQASPSTSKAMQFTRSTTNYSFEIGTSNDSLGWYDLHNSRYVFRSTTSNFLINETGALRTLINTGTDDGVNTLQVAGSSAFAGNLTLSDTNLITGTATGTIIATANSQKLGFWGATPIVQPTTAVAAATLVSNLGTPITSTDTFDGYTLQQIVRALRLMGKLQ